MDSKPRVLIGMESAQMIAALTRLLRHTYRTSAARNAESVLRIAARSLPELILLGTDMRGIGGYGVCICLQVCASTRDIPVVFVSEGTNSEEVYRSLQVGAADHFIAPVSPDLFLARVQTLVDERWAHRTYEFAEFADDLIQPATGKAGRKRPQYANEEFEGRDDTPAHLTARSTDRKTSALNNASIEWNTGKSAAGIVPSEKPVNGGRLLSAYSSAGTVLCSHEHGQIPFEVNSGGRTQVTLSVEGKLRNVLSEIEAVLEAFAEQAEGVFSPDFGQLAKDFSDVINSSAVAKRRLKPGSAAVMDAIFLDTPWLLRDADGQIGIDQKLLLDACRCDFFRVAEVFAQIGAIACCIR